MGQGWHNLQINYTFFYKNGNVNHELQIRFFTHKGIISTIDILTPSTSATGQPATQPFLKHTNDNSLWYFMAYKLAANDPHASKDSQKVMTCSTKREEKVCVQSAF